MTFYETYYGIGSVIIGLILIIDNVLILTKKSAVDAGSKDGQGSLSYFFMLAEAGWIGVSVMQLINGNDTVVPLFYLGLSAFSFIAGAVFKNPKSLKLPDWVVVISLVGSVAFTFIAYILL